MLLTVNASAELIGHAAMCVRLKLKKDQKRVARDAASGQRSPESAHQRIERGQRTLAMLEGAYQRAQLQEAAAAIPAAPLHGAISTERLLRIIRQHVAGSYAVPITELMRPSRRRRYAEPRQVAMYLSRILSDAGLTEIGEQFNRDHTTALHGFNRIADRLKTDVDLANRINRLKADINLEAVKAVQS